MNTKTDDRLAEATSEDDLVARCFACPFCGERRMDHLEWDSAGEMVACPCGANYNPSA